MIVRTLLVSGCIASTLAASALAQPASTPTPSAQPPAVAPAQPQPRGATTMPAPAVAIAPRREGQPINIKVDVTITDQRTGGTATKKTVSIVTADGLGGFIRSQSQYRNIGEVPLNVDAEPFLLTDGKIRVRVNLQYELPAPSSAAQLNNVAPQVGTLSKTSIHENLSLILESGKSIVAAQSADPVDDRQVTIELKATVLK